MYKLLDVGRNDVLRVGIWRLGGIGKTTVAKAIYNSIAHEFEGSYFLEDVRERSMPYGGLVELQNSLLSNILGGNEFKVTNVDKGINVIKERLSNKMILLILDDVNELDQLQKLVGRPDWFGSGSRVIITTRDVNFLITHEVKPEKIYKVKELDDHEALELFSWNAFRSNLPKDDYVDLAEMVVRYCQGLTLALTVFGSHLCGRGVEQWQDAINTYKRAPNKKIQDILQISFTSLENLMKEAFLHIVCFFKGKYKSYVENVLEACDLKPKYGIEVLREKALITIDHDGYICMHDLLEEMGKEKVHQESPDDPGKRSRLWYHEDVYRVLTESTGTNKIKGIMVKLLEPDVICLQVDSFAKMTNLQLFINCNAQFSGDRLDYLSNELRIIEWPTCPLKALPSSFNPKKLVKFHLLDSRLSQFGEGLKRLQNLKSINFSGCKFLTKVSDLSGVPNLKDLNLSNCLNLVEVGPSVGFLNKLVFLSLTNCYNLTMFPKKINLKSLEFITAFGCRRLDTFPEIVGKMESLRDVMFAGTAIKELPPSIGNLSNLQSLCLDGCGITNLPATIYELQRLSNFTFYRSPKLVTMPKKVKSDQVSHDSCGSLVLPRLYKLCIAGGSLVLPHLYKLCIAVSETNFLETLDCASTLFKLDLSSRMHWQFCQFGYPYLAGLIFEKFQNFHQI